MEQPSKGRVASVVVSAERFFPLVGKVPHRCLSEQPPIGRNIQHNNGGAHNNGVGINRWVCPSRLFLCCWLSTTSQHCYRSRCWTLDSKKPSWITCWITGVQLQATLTTNNPNNPNNPNNYKHDKSHNHNDNGHNYNGDNEKREWLKQDQQEESKTGESMMQGAALKTTRFGGMGFSERQREWHLPTITR